MSGRGGGGGGGGGGVGRPSLVHRPRETLRQHQAAVKALAWCPSQRHLLASGGGTADRTIKVRTISVGRASTAEGDTAYHRLPRLLNVKTERAPMAAAAW